MATTPASTPRAKAKRFSKRRLRLFLEEYARKTLKVEKLSLQDFRDTLRDRYEIAVAPSTLGNWLRDTNASKPDVDSLRALCDLFDKSWEDFFE